MTNYKIIKLKYGIFNLSDKISEAIVTYCLAQMNNDELNYEKWIIGISKNKGKFEEGKGKSWLCSSANEAIDTKKYFIKDKIMTSDKHNNKNNNGLYLYVKRP